MTYTMTWTPASDDDAVTVPLRDLTPDALCDAAANADVDYSLFTDTFIYRTLYALCYQLLHNGDAEVTIGEFGSLLVVPRVV